MLNTTAAAIVYRIFIEYKTPRTPAIRILSPKFRYFLTICVVMPPTRDRARIRAILDTDRAWTAYALGDLSPAFYDQCEWHVPADRRNALLMLFPGVDPPILFAHGDVRDIEQLIDEVGTLAAVDLHVRPAVVRILKARYAES